MEKLQNEMSIDIKVYRGFEKLIYSWECRGQPHTQGYVGKTGIGTELSPLTDLEVLHKQDMKTKELSTTRFNDRGIPQNTY